MEAGDFGSDERTTQHGDLTMHPTVRYTDRESAVQDWPLRIVSPTHESPYCAAHSQTVGHPHLAERYSYQYRVCGVCGFAVRRIVHEFPDMALAADIRASLAKVFTRRPYHYLGGEA